PSGCRAPRRRSIGIAAGATTWSSPRSAEPLPASPLAARATDKETMFDHATLVPVLGLIALAAPVLLLCVLGIASLLNRPRGEAATGRLAQAAIVTGLVASVAVLALMLLDGTRHESIELGEWVVIPGYHFSVKLTFDRLSVPFAILSFVLCGTVAAFAT